MNNTSHSILLRFYFLSSQFFQYWCLLSLTGGEKVLDVNKEKALLMIELDEYYDRLDTAERYDNLGDKEWYSEMIEYTKAKLDRLDEAV